MAFEQRDNSGAIFKNDKKTQDSHPDGKGSAMIDGVEYWISSWNKTSASGTSFRTLSFQRKEGTPSQQRQQPQVTAKKATGGGSRQTRNDDFDADIPFISCEVTHDMETSKAKKLRKYDYQAML